MLEGLNQFAAAMLSLYGALALATRQGSDAE